MTAWIAADALVEQVGIDEAERRLQKRYSEIEAGEKEERDRVLGALGRVRMLQEQT